MKPGKIIQTANAFLKAKLLNKKAPLVVGWAITDKCNRKCACCDIWQGPVRDLPTTRVFEIVDTLARMGALRISFTGGEPLLRKDMGKIIDYVHEKGIETKLNTNGALVKRKIKQLKNLDMMNLSLEGPEEIHDAIRGKGSFNEVMEAVRTAKAHNIKFNFASVLTRINLDAVDYILDKARQKNCKVVFQPATRITLGSQRPNNLVSRENEYREVIKKLIKIKKSGDKAIGNSVQGLAHLSKWPRPENIKCASGWRQTETSCTAAGNQWRSRLQTVQTSVSGKHLTDWVRFPAMTAGARPELSSI